MALSCPPPASAGGGAPADPPLKRSLGLWLLTLYGLGTTIGAGIYVLIGAVAERSGALAPWSFLLAAALAGLSAFAFAELSRRHPQSAGEAHYVLVAFGSRRFSLAVGLTVVAVAVISAATIARGAAGYLGLFLPLPPWLLTLAATLLLGLLAAWGIEASARVAGACTLIEVGGLVLVIGAAALLLGAAEGPPDLAPLVEGLALEPVLAGTLVAFFAFVGFEHMVNVAEEVHAPSRALPRAILLTLAITTLLYLLLAALAVLALPLETLAASAAPLALIWQSAGGGGWLLGAIGVFATLNGLLTMTILGARVLYGLARQGSLPGWFGRVHAGRRTPVGATLLVSGLAAGAALLLPIGELAELASLATLLVFAAVNAALLAVYRREGQHGPRLALPLCGLASIGGLLAYELVQRLG